MIQSYQKNQIQIIELDRPKVNAINQELLQSLKDELNVIEKNDSIKRDA